MFDHLVKMMAGEYYWPRTLSMGLARFFGTSLDGQAFGRGGLYAEAGEEGE